MTEPTSYQLAISRALIAKENANVRTKKISKREQARRAAAEAAEREARIAAMIGDDQ